jgi:hypothetical protein
MRAEPTRWTQERLLKCIYKQVPFLRRNRISLGEDLIWFGSVTNDPIEDWVQTRSHCHSLHILATLYHGAKEGKISLAADEMDALRLDLQSGITAACRTHVTDASPRPAGAEGTGWGGSWQSALWAYSLLRTYFLFDKEEVIRSRVRQIAEFEANRFIGVTPPSGVYEDTKMEENSWDAPLMAWASFLFPDHPNAPEWERCARLWAFNAATTAQDRFDFRLLEHQSVSKWTLTTTLHPDCTTENHGCFHTNYQSGFLGNAQTAAAYLLHGRSVPRSILHRMEDVAEVLAWCLAPDSTQLMFTGNDWHTAHGLHSCLSLVAHVTGNKVLATLGEGNLTRCEQLLEQSDDGHVFGSTAASNVIGARFFFHVCNLTLLPEVFPFLPSSMPLMSEQELLDRYTGGKRWPYVQVSLHRNRRRVVSAAWRTLYGHPLFVFLPLADNHWSGWAPFTGLGRLQVNPKVLEGFQYNLADHGAGLTPDIKWHEEDASDAGLRTRGVILWRNEAHEPVARQEIGWETDGEACVRLKEEIVALRSFELATNDGFYFSFANDLGNGCKREVEGDGRKFVVQALAGKPADYAVGERCTIDGLVTFSSDCPLTYYSSGARLSCDNRFETTQFDRVLTRCKVGPFSEGSIIRKGEIAVQLVG